jgi:hypothetical protein
MQSWKCLQIRCISLVLMLFITIPVWADVLISEINGKHSDFEIKRNGEVIKFFQFTRLQAGDEISVLTKPIDPNKGQFDELPYSITLSINDNTKELTQTKSYYKVTPEDVAGISYNVPKGIMNVVSVWFKRLWIYDVVMVELNAKGDTPEDQFAMPLLKGVNAKLIAGERPLYLGWYQGKPPYNVKVFCKEKFCKEGAFFEQTVQDDEEVALEIRPYWTGQNYEVVLSDAEGMVITSTFTVVAKTQSVLSTSEAQEIVQSNLPSKEKKTLLAAWLASQGQKWKLEAYQQVANATRKTNSSAFLVKQGLQAGIK